MDRTCECTRLPPFRIFTRDVPAGDRPQAMRPGAGASIIGQVTKAGLSRLASR